MTDQIDTAASGWETARDDGIRLLEARDLAAATDRLASAASGDPTGESEALLGLAHFHAERYAEAAGHYDSALIAGGDDGQLAEWADLAESSRANAAAEVDEPVPPVYYFDRAQLLGPPEAGSLPDPRNTGSSWASGGGSDTSSGAAWGPSAASRSGG